MLFELVMNFVSRVWMHELYWLRTVLKLIGSIAPFVPRQGIQLSNNRRMILFSSRRDSLSLAVIEGKDMYINRKW